MDCVLDSAGALFGLWYSLFDASDFWFDRNNSSPDLMVERGKWICVEHMMKLNDVGDSNGEQALWIDGKLVSHLSKGNPKGVWIFDKFTPGKGGPGIRWNDAKGDREGFQVPAAGAPFDGFRWRTDPALNLNFVWLYIYTQKPAGHRMQVWFDDLVVATEYVGPVRARSRSGRRSSGGRTHRHWLIASKTGNFCGPSCGRISCARPCGCRG